jgi:hypothetical protein
VLNKAAGFSVDVGGVKWAYRKSEPAAAKATPDKIPVLLLHGLGSSSWSYRYGVRAVQQLCNWHDEIQEVLSVTTYCCPGWQMCGTTVVRLHTVLLVAVA